MKKIYVAIVILVLLGLSLYLMEGDVKDDKCRDSDGEDINDCDTISFKDCIECGKKSNGVLVFQHCGHSKKAKKEQCLDHDLTKDFPSSELDFKDTFCRRNENATYGDCKSVNYEKVYCDNNPNKKGEDVKKCKDDLITSDYCTGDNMANYEDCQYKNYEKYYCDFNPNVKWDNYDDDDDNDVNKCCSSATGNILNDYINDYTNKTPTPFDTPKINIPLPTKGRGRGGITKHACTLRENCKNIDVTPENVYPVRRLCSNITIGYGTNNDKDSKKYDFSDSICDNIKQLVEDRFNDKHLAYPKEDNQEDDVKKDGLVGKIDEDGVYTFYDYEGKEHIYNYLNDYYTTYNKTIKKKIEQNGYDNLIREYCHCREYKPEICKIF